MSGASATPVKTICIIFATSFWEKLPEIFSQNVMGKICFVPKINKSKKLPKMAQNQKQYEMAKTFFFLYRINYWIQKAI